MTSTVAVVGDLMVDVIVAVRSAFSHASDTASTITTSPGGAAANQACWMARAGMSVRMIGAVGDDPFGDEAVRALEAEGIDVATVIRVSSASTGVVVALVEPDGQRSMLTDRGANLALRADDVAAAWSAAPAPTHLHLSAYTLFDDRSRAAGLAALEAARRSGATISLDTCSAGPLEGFGAANLLEATESLHWLFVNEAEAAALVGHDRPAAMAQSLLAHAAEVVLTLGPSGVRVARRGHGDVVRAASAVAVTDTTGAGDATCGTYLARRLAGASVADALAAADEAAATVVATRGARSWHAPRYSRE